MDLERLIQIATRNSHHFVDDPDDRDEPGRVKSISPVGDCALAELGVAWEEHNFKADAVQMLEAEARLVEAAVELRAIAASIAKECPDDGESEPSTEHDVRVPFDVA